MKTYCYIMFFVATIVLTSCATLSGKKIMIYDANPPPNEGSYILENNTERKIYYYGFEEGIPWVFLEYYYEDTWIPYASCHTINQLKLFSLDSCSKRAFSFPMLDCVEGWPDKHEPRQVRIKFPYSYNKHPIKPNSGHTSTEVEKWRYVYGYFTLPLNPEDVKRVR